ncbi:MAG: YaaL family protein [Kyrpidia tusciae]|nr:YaaL family protein [Kyrpidia tusciae]MBE3552187.1 YaaL family protein [Kyrpidia tusciae]
MKPILRWARCKRRTREGNEAERERAELLIEIRRTRDEWMRAQHLLDNVVEPELIDHAIYAVQAAQRKYEYLMKVARKQHLSVPPEEGLLRGAARTPAVDFQGHDGVRARSKGR